MTFYVKHGPRVYRPIPTSNFRHSEVQFFRFRWGTRRADDVGAGKMKLNLTWDRRRFGLSLEARHDGERKRSIVLLIGMASFRLGWTRAAPRATRERAGVV